MLEIIEKRIQELEESLKGSIANHNAIYGALMELKALFPKLQAFIQDAKPVVDVVGEVIPQVAPIADVVDVIANA